MSLLLKKATAQRGTGGPHLPLEALATKPISVEYLESNRATRSFLSCLAVTGLPLCICDTLVILACSSLAGLVVSQFLGGIWPSTFRLLLIGLGVTSPALFYLYGLYPAIGLNAAEELRRTFKAGLMLALTYIAATTAQGLQPGSNTLIVALSAPLWLVTLPLARIWARRRLAGYSWWGLRTIVLGDSSEIAQAVFAKLRDNPEHGLRVIGFVDDLHSLNSLQAIASESDVQHAVVAMPDAPLRDVLRFLANGDHGFLQFTIIPSVDESFDLGLQAIDVGNRTLGLVGQQRLLFPTNRWLKRLFDVSSILAAAIFVLPVVACIALAIKLTSKGPVFYKNRRIGRHGRQFYAWKFRSMVPDAEQVLAKYLDQHPELREEWERDTKLKHDPRITAVGHILRRTSLDELPQLWNVLRGEMSLVGPRPILDNEVSKYADVFELYQKVLPGITGLWQVSGRNNTTYEERLTLVASYVRNWSIWLDLCIMAKTVIVVARRDGAY